MSVSAAELTAMARARELALDVLAGLLEHEVAAGAPERAVRAALRLVALDPLREQAHRALMRLYAAQGRRGAALRGRGGVPDASGIEPPVGLRAGRKRLDGLAGAVAVEPGRVPGERAETLVARHLDALVGPVSARRHGHGR